MGDRRLCIQIDAGQERIGDVAGKCLIEFGKRGVCLAVVQHRFGQLQRVVRAEEGDPAPPEPRVQPALAEIDGGWQRIGYPSGTKSQLKLVICPPRLFITRRRRTCGVGLRSKAQHRESRVGLPSRPEVLDLTQHYQQYWQFRRYTT